MSPVAIPVSIEQDATLGRLAPLEISQSSASLQVQKMCCPACLTSSYPAQCFCPQHHPQLCQPPCLHTSWEATVANPAPGVLDTPRRGIWVGYAGGSYQ